MSTEVIKVPLSLDSFRLGYLAAITDGEGSISIYSTRRPTKSDSNHYLHSVIFTITNTELDILEAVKDIVGFGNIYLWKRHKLTGNRKPSYGYRVTNRRLIYNLLVELKNYFMSERKKRLADLIMEFIESREQKGGCGFDSPYSQREIEIVNEVGLLNEKGRRKKQF